MKKNIIGHMTAPQESARGRWKRLDLIPKLLCLLLALVIWLSVDYVSKNVKPSNDAPLPFSHSVNE